MAVRFSSSLPGRLLPSLGPLPHMGPAPNVPNQLKLPEGGAMVLPGQNLLIQDVGLGEDRGLETS